MNDERRHFWGGYLARLCGLMGLHGWTPIIYEEPAEDGNAAMVRTVYGRKRFEIRLALDFDRRAPEDQRQTCVHELLHVHFGAYSHHEQALRDTHGNGWLAAGLDAMHLQMEYAVDAIADVLAPFLPLPEDGEPEDRATLAAEAERDAGRVTPHAD